MTNPLYDALFGCHAKNQDVFLRLADGGTISYADFVSRAGQMASVLRSFDFAPGDRVALQVDKSPDALAVCAACIQCGFVFLPLNPAYTAKEIAYFLEDSGAKLFLCPEANRDDLSAVAAACDAQLETFGKDGSGSFLSATDLWAPSTEITARKSDDLAAFLYTSGTTGRSKGAMLSQDNLLSNAQTLATHWQFTKDDVLLHALPIFHTHGLFVATNTTLLTGGSMIFMEKFDAGPAVAQLSHATAMMGVPTFYTRLLADPEFTGASVAHMRLFISGSAPMLAATHQAFTDRTGHHVLERYGMTETNMSTSNPYNGQRKAGTVGLPLPDVELKITNPDTGETLPNGEIGTIEVRGPNVFQGYWQMPEKTAQELRPDGFFITGDLAQMDDRGYVTIVGRDKDLIISGGFNVYPKEVESVLDDQPDVLESAVIGVPHPDMGEAVIAVIARQPASLPHIETIQLAIGQSLARFKQPRKLEFVDALPRNAMGKVQKNALRDQYANIFQTTSDKTTC